MDTTVANLSIFTNSTKKICMCSFISIFLIILFVISPLSNFFKTSILMRLITLLILFYTLYLNNIQTNSLREVNLDSKSEQIKSQININIICSYVFTLFLSLLAIFVIKSFI